MTAVVIDAAERKLKRVKISLLRNDRLAFWRGVMMVGKTELRDDIPTACTDGCNEYYGRALVEQLNEKELAFVILHENRHKIGRDMTVWRRLFNENKALINAACDYYINLSLVDMDPMETMIAFPRTSDGERMGLYDERFRGMSVPQIYRLLKDEAEASGGAGGGGDGDGDGNFDEHDWGGAAQRTKEQQDKLEKEIDQALRQGEIEHRRLNGDQAGNMERSLNELLQPKIDWREVLSEFVRSTCSGRDTSSWRRPNRRYLAQDIFMPSFISERVGRVIVGVDTSGSIGGSELTSFLSEVAAIANEVRPEKIDLLYWDTRVARHEEYDEANLDLLFSSTKPAGGGGTDVNCVFNYAKEKRIEPECCIILTDGYTPWPKEPPEYPTLWVITTRSITAPNGVTVHMDN